MGKDRAVFVAQLIDEEDGEKIHRELGEKIHRDQQGDLLQGDSEAFVKGDKQQGQKIDDHGLHQIASEAAGHSQLIVLFHGNSSIRIGFIIAKMEENARIPIPFIRSSFVMLFFASGG